MFDCANVEMRERLPELVAGTLDATTRARVEEHVAACPECASELETLRLVRAAFARAPKIDASRVVASLPRPRAVVAAPRRNAKVIRWLDWRIAAALTTITVGGLSLAVSQRMRDVTAVLPSDSAQVQSHARPQQAGRVVVCVELKMPISDRLPRFGQRSWIGSMTRTSRASSTSMIRLKRHALPRGRGARSGSSRRAWCSAAASSGWASGGPRS